MQELKSYMAKKEIIAISTTKKNLNGLIYCTFYGKRSFCVYLSKRLQHIINDSVGVSIESIGNVGITYVTNGNGSGRIKLCCK